MADEDVDGRARWRNLVRQGYDTISSCYRDDAGRPNREATESTDRYREWVDELAKWVEPGGDILDLGCGAGLPDCYALLGIYFVVVIATSTADATWTSKATAVAIAAFFLASTILSIAIIWNLRSRKRQFNTAKGSRAHRRQGMTRGSR